MSKKGQTRSSASKIVRGPPDSDPKVAACRICSLPDTDRMVQCDRCDRWCHFACVAVTSSTETEDWICQLCGAPEGAIPKSYSNVQPIESGDKSNKNENIRAPIEQERSQAKNKQPSVKSKTSSIKRKQLELQRLEEERAMTEKRDREYLEKKYEILGETDDDTEEEEEVNMERTTEWIAQIHHNSNGEKKIDDGPTAAVHTERKVPPIIQKHSETACVAPANIPIDRASPQLIWPPRQTDNEPEKRGLNQSHLAARQVLAKDLPSFGGRPEEWPIFLSNFESSTKSCGYTNEENLLRLQRSLKGPALEAVRFKLLLPSMVPDIIATLRMLYGRPELIIHTLLQKVRHEAGQAEKLDTIINYALSVQNLCATIEASGLNSHLCNPSLIQELTDKLPPSLKLTWAVHRQTIPHVDLSTFGQWLFTLAQAASSVTLIPYMPSHPMSSDSQRRTSRKDTGHVFAHALESKSNSRNKTNKVDYKCSLCESNAHCLTDCEEFLKMDKGQKWDTVTEFHLCRKCLNSHHERRCKSSKVCGIDHCIAKHHPLLHNDKKPYTGKSSRRVERIDDPTCNVHYRNNQSIFFRIIPVTLFGKNISLRTFAFLDDGSSITLLEQSLCDQLGVKGTPESLCLRWTADNVRVEEHSQVISIGISGGWEGETRHIYKMSDVRTVNCLNLPTQSICAEHLMKTYPHLNGISLKSYTDAVPRLLIGLDNFKLGIPMEVREGQWKESAAAKTRLGWVAHGIYEAKGKISHSNRNDDTKSHSFHACECKTDSELHQLIKEFYLLESFGVKRPEKILEPLVDQRAKSILEATTKKNLNQFETGLLWRYNDVQLPNNFHMAKRRLICLEKKMKADPELGELIKGRIGEYQEKGYVRKLLPKEIVENKTRVWYLPIFTVTNPNKPGKVRIVWDAAAKVEGISLNSMLLKGPDQLVPLPAVLQRFRQRKIAICGDICEMFHQIKIRKQDQNSQRFLWRDKEEDVAEQFVMTVMTFGATCSPSSAQYVKNLNANEFVETFPRAVQAITENHYVDDWLDSVDTVEAATLLAREVRDIHKHGGFKIRNWLSNSRTVLEILNESSFDENKNLDISAEVEGDKVLGMWWCTKTDTFKYPLHLNKVNRAILTGEKRPTKREVLRTLMAIFDPLGFLSFYLVPLKILMQEIWRSSIDWDDQIKDDQYKRWLSWTSILDRLRQIKIPRCYTQKVPIGNCTVIQLHVFVDASVDAYAAVAFFRIQTEDVVECALVAAKTEVAPQQPWTIPRLELQAAVLGVRLANSICESHTISVSEKYMWSDSKTVLAWLRSDHRRYKQFVAFRVGEILETSNEWASGGGSHQNRMWRMMRRNGKERQNLLLQKDGSRALISYVNHRQIGHRKTEQLTRR